MTDYVRKLNWVCSVVENFFKYSSFYDLYIQFSWFVSKISVVFGTCTHRYNARLNLYFLVYLKYFCFCYFFKKNWFIWIFLHVHLNYFYVVKYMILFIQTISLIHAGADTGRGDIRPHWQIQEGRSPAPDRNSGTGA